MDLRKTNTTNLDGLHLVSYHAPFLCIGFVFDFLNLRICLLDGLCKNLILGVVSIRSSSQIVYTSWDVHLRHANL